MRVIRERSGAGGPRSVGEELELAVDVEALDGGHLLTLGVADPAELVRRAFRNAAAAAELVRSIDLLIRDC